jgi:hypothetical protein
MRAISAWGAAAALLVVAVRVNVLQADEPATPSSPTPSSPALITIMAHGSLGISESPTIEATGFAARFRVPFRYVLPDGWELTTETSSEVVFARGPERVRIVDDAKPPTGCAVPIDESARFGPADLVRSLEHRPFVTPRSSPTTIGGLNGLDIAITIHPAGQGFTPVYEATDGNRHCSVTQLLVGYHRLVALDDGAGKTILIQIAASDPRLRSEGALIVASLAFDP